MALATSPISSRIGLLLVLLSTWTGTAVAQNITLDEGSFRITIAGRDVGSESFSIRQSGPDANPAINARGNVTIDSAGTAEELRSALQLTGPALQPTAYNLRIVGERGEEQIAGRIVAGRFIAKILSPTGEELREYLASERAVLIDRGIIHHYYFLARRMEGDSLRVPVIIPRQGRQIAATVRRAGEEEVIIGGRRTMARRLVVTPTEGNEVHLWVDDRSRVLRLEVPALRFDARRSTMPRN